MPDYSEQNVLKDLDGNVIYKHNLSSSKASKKVMLVSAMDNGVCVLPRVDLSESTLEEIYIDHANFVEGSFRRSVIPYSSFTGCDFTGCDFTGTNIVDVQFKSCIMRGCKFDGDTQFGSTRFFDCHLNDSKGLDVVNGIDRTLFDCCLLDNTGVFHPRSTMVSRPFTLYSISTMTVRVVLRVFGEREIKDIVTQVNHAGKIVFESKWRKLVSNSFRVIFSAGQGAFAHKDRTWHRHAAGFAGNMTINTAYHYLSVYPNKVIFNRPALDCINEFSPTHPIFNNKPIPTTVNWPPPGVIVNQNNPRRHNDRDEYRDEDHDGEDDSYHEYIHEYDEEEQRF